jgi:hypothetical protein
MGLCQDGHNRPDKGVIYQGAFGKRDLQTGTEMTPDTVF